jgi:hypothetical protein
MVVEHGPTDGPYDGRSVGNPYLTGRQGCPGLAHNL